MKQKYAQITLRNGIHIQIGIEVNGAYTEMKRRLTETKNEFIEMTPGCIVRREDVVLLELLTYTIEEEQKDED